jgi:hypothetical protein
MSPAEMPATEMTASEMAASEAAEVTAAKTPEMTGARNRPDLQRQPQHDFTAEGVSAMN